MTRIWQVIAAALQRELYRIDLSSLVSKYVGETSKNISCALSQVPNDEVLLFDEADAAFGRRVELTDANSHFLNADTSHLLQAVEDYSLQREDWLDEPTCTCREDWDTYLRIEELGRSSVDLDRFLA